MLARVGLRKRYCRRATPDSNAAWRRIVERGLIRARRYVQSLARVVLRKR
jgi:hypothetical protein